MATNAKTVTASIRFLFDVSAMPQAAAQLQKLDKAATSLQGGLNKVNQMTQKMDDISSNLRDFSDRVIQPMQDMAQNFVQYVGATNSIGQTWLKTSLQLEQAQLRIGRTAAKALQPMQQTIADITEKTADFIDQHPEIVKLAAGTAGIAAGAAAVISAGSQLMGILSAGAQQLMNAARFLATSRVGIGGAALGAGAVGGFFAGKAIAGGLANAGLMDKDYAKAVQAQGPLDLLKNTIKVLGMITLGWSRLIDLVRNSLKETFAYVSALWEGVKSSLTVGGDFQKAFDEEYQKRISAAKINSDKAVVDFFNGITDQIDQLSSGTGAGNQSKIIQDQILYGFEGFLQQMQQAQAQYQLQVEQQTKQFNDQQAMEAENNARQEQQQIDDFNRDQQKTREDFYRQEQLRQVDFQKQQQRSEQDHRRNLQDAAARLDALAVLQEMRQHTTDKTRAQEDFKSETQRNKEEFARQEDLAKDNFRRQLDRQRSEFRVQQQQAKAQFNAQMQQAAQQYQLQLKQQSDSFRLQLQQQNAAMFGMEQRSQQYWDTLSKQLQAFMAGTAIPGGTNTTTTYSGGTTVGGTTTTVPVRQRALAGGGYANTGDKTHSGEFVLTRNATSAMERLAGRPLTQGGVLAMVGAGGGFSPSLNMNFYGVGDKSPSQLKNEIQPAVEGALINILRKYNKK